MTKIRRGMKGEEGKARARTAGFTRQLIRLIGDALIQGQRAAVMSHGETTSTGIPASEDLFPDPTQKSEHTQGSILRHCEEQATWRIAKHRREFNVI